MERKKRKHRRGEKRYFKNRYELSSSAPSSAILGDNIRSLAASLGIDEANDYSIYTGHGGLAYIYLKLGLAENDSHAKASYLKNAKQQLTAALDIVRAHEDTLRRRREITFVTGMCGIYTLAAWLAHLEKDSNACGLCADVTIISAEYTKKVSDAIVISHDETFTANEILYGRAGYLYCLLFLVKYTGNSSLLPACHNVVKKIIQQGKQLPSRSPLMWEWHHSQYLGGAHGVSGILYILLQVPGILEDAETRKLIIGVLEYLLTLKGEDGNYPTREGGSTDLVQWCHGAPAFSMLFVRAYEMLKDAKYLQAAEAAADVVWQKGLLKKGVSLCHGTGGNGYTFLHLYRVTKDEKHLRRALLFADFMLSPKGRSTFKTPDHPNSLFEGIAGGICYLLDCLSPLNPCFPSWDV